MSDARGESFVPFPETPKLVEARIAAHPAGGRDCLLAIKEQHPAAYETWFSQRQYETGGWRRTEPASRSRWREESDGPDTPLPEMGTPVQSVAR